MRQCAYDSRFRLVSRARRMALALVCATGLMGGTGMAVAPGTALAACANITGSGSVLQGEQQSRWSGEWGGCATVTYTSTNDLLPYEEFDIEGELYGRLQPALSGNGAKLDAFIGVTAPPGWDVPGLSWAEHAAETPAETVPIAEEPIVLLLHPPAACEVSGAGFNIPNSVLNELWQDHYATWSAFLAQVAGVTTKGTCTQSIELEVPSGYAGTAYALKQYLCQIDPSLWGESLCEGYYPAYLNTAPDWPETVHTEHIESGKKSDNGQGGLQEARAVEETEGSVGFVSLANAVSAGFKSFAESKTLFWATINNRVEPVKAGTEGNCPVSYSFPPGIETEAQKGDWVKVHLDNPSWEGAYPICTFMYDVGWENYETDELEKEYGGRGKEVGETTKAYFEYMTAKKEGQENIASYYSELPENVREVAEKIAVERVG